MREKGIKLFTASNILQICYRKLEPCYFLYIEKFIMQQIFVKVSMVYNAHNVNREITNLMGTIDEHGMGKRKKKSRADKHTRSKRKEEEKSIRRHDKQEKRREVEQTCATKAQPKQRERLNHNPNKEKTLI
jgi:hypothetical protein